MDVKLQNHYFLYAGDSDEGDDELAMKAAGIERRASVQRSKFLPHGFSVPMQCLVDFQGFRVVLCF